MSFEECLQSLASVPVGRIGFAADGEVIMLPVNHVMDGQDVIFRTVAGSKLSAAEDETLVAFQADGFDAETRSGWSVLINGRAEVVYDETEIERLSRLGVEPWVTTVERPFWIRIRPISVTGRRTPGAGGTDAPAKAGAGG